MSAPRDSVTLYKPSKSIHLIYVDEREKTKPGKRHDADLPQLLHRKSNWWSIHRTPKIKKASSADPTLYTSVTQRVKREGMREEEEKDTWAQGPMYASNWKLLMSVGTGRLGSKKVLLSNTMGSFACMFIP